MYCSTPSKALSIDYNSFLKHAESCLRTQVGLTNTETKVLFGTSLVKALERTLSLFSLSEVKGIEEKISALEKANVDEELSSDLVWAADVMRSKQVPRINASPTMIDRFTGVVNFQSKKYVVNTDSDLFHHRHALIASIVEQRLSYLGPKVFPAIVNGKPVVLREFVDGELLSVKRNNLHAFRKLFNIVQNNPKALRSYWDMRAIEFLKADADGDGSNIMYVEKESRFINIDNGYTATGGVKSMIESAVLGGGAFTFAVGSGIPPEKYSAEFIEKLKKWDNDKIEDDLIDVASPQEVLMIQKYRIMLLADSVGRVE